MNISWKWLSELIDLKNMKPQELASQLTLAGFEVENIIVNSTKDNILHINTSANRLDTLNLIGITREISAIIKHPIRRINNQKHLNIKHEKIIIDDSKSCYYNYLHGYLTNITIGDSPTWLQYKLECYGIKSQNNITDIINLIEIKWGLSLKILDKDKINYKNSIQNTKNSKQNNIIFESDFKRSAYIDKYTKSIILCARISTNSYDKSKEIFQLPRHISNNSISTTKQKKSCDLLHAYSETILLISYICGGKVKEIRYLTNPTIKYKPFYIKKSYINNILGFTLKTTINMPEMRQEIPDKEITEILNYLNCQVEDQVNNWKVEIPSYRSQDLIRVVDLIGEIGRIYGFDKCIDKTPYYCKTGIKNNEYLKINQIKEILRSIGLTETIHYSLVKREINHLRLYNPLIEDYKYLRDNIINNLIEANYNNIKQDNEPIEAFELGKVFKKFHKTYSESINIAGIMGGKEYYRSEWSQKPAVLTWFQAKGDLEELFERLQIYIRWNKPFQDYDLYHRIKHIFHPNRLAVLYKDKQPIGLFGQLDLRICKKFNIPEYTYGFELELYHLISTKNKYDYYFKSYSKYPYIMRDITLSTTNHVEVQTLLYKINNKLDPLVESITIFDSYTIRKKSETIHHLGFRLKYRSKINTLTNAMVENLNKKIEHTIKKYL
uniref:phenylalanine--tRNA ligase n=1 Tax=Sheathia arcuata TaxID=340433 RepID=A0A3G1I8Y5_9FLOR|nr:phenylalanine--tRNA ligase beta subunit [Sheathia arcuata]ART65404.1 phenylalanine--tRNA ligase beta subunit [Sheathia arcuata]